MPNDAAAFSDVLDQGERLVAVSSFSSRTLLSKTDDESSNDSGISDLSAHSSTTTLAPPPADLTLVKEVKDDLPKPVDDENNYEDTNASNSLFLPDSSTLHTISLVSCSSSATFKAYETYSSQKSDLALELDKPSEALPSGWSSSESCHSEDDEYDAMQQVINSKENSPAPSRNSSNLADVMPFDFFFSAEDNKMNPNNNNLLHTPSSRQRFFPSHKDETPKSTLFAGRKRSSACLLSPVLTTCFDNVVDDVFHPPTDDADAVPPRRRQRLSNAFLNPVNPIIRSGQTESVSGSEKQVLFRRAFSNTDGKRPRSFKKSLEVPPSPQLEVNFDFSASRREQLAGASDALSETSSSSSRASVPLLRTTSMSVFESKANLNESGWNPQILTVTYRLPAVEIPKAPSTTFRSISAGTLKNLVTTMSEEEFNNEFILLDCRYPYEFNGGHIKYAKNFHDRKKVSSLFFPTNDIDFCAAKERVPIFYCEFSEVRAPGMAQALRHLDRTKNESSYPYVDYAEMYVLDMGYKNFFETYHRHEDHVCTPDRYVRMKSKRHAKQCKQFTYHLAATSRHRALNFNKRPPQPQLSMLASAVAGSTSSSSMVSFDTFFGSPLQSSTPSVPKRRDSSKKPAEAVASADASDSLQSEAGGVLDQELAKEAAANAMTAEEEARYHQWDSTLEESAIDMSTASMR